VDVHAILLFRDIYKKNNPNIGVLETWIEVSGQEFLAL